MPTGIPGTMLASGGQPRTAYGSVPAPIGVPANLFTQLSGAVPNFAANTAGTGNVIGSQLAGTVSPGTMNALKTGAAQFGVANGMPGSGLEQNQLFGNIAGFSEGQQQKGVQNYLAQVGALGPTMTNPNLAAEIAARNADYAAAPDPKLAADQAFKDWLRGFSYTQSAANPNKGPWYGGGTLGPAHSNWGGTGMNPPDDLGFSNYNMTPDPQGVYTATATPPSGGWPTSQPWNAGFSTSPPSPSPYYYTGTNVAGEYDAGVDPTNPYNTPG